MSERSEVEYFESFDIDRASLKLSGLYSSMKIRTVRLLLLYMQRRRYAEFAALSGMRCEAKRRCSSLKNHKVRFEEDISVYRKTNAGVGLHASKTDCDKLAMHYCYSRVHLQSSPEVVSVPTSAKLKFAPATVAILPPTATCASGSCALQGKITPPTSWLSVAP